MNRLGKGDTKIAVTTYENNTIYVVGARTLETGEKKVFKFER